MERENANLPSVVDMGVTEMNLHLTTKRRNQDPRCL